MAKWAAEHSINTKRECKKFTSRSPCHSIEGGRQFVAIIVHQSSGANASQKWISVHQHLSLHSKHKSRRAKNANSNNNGKPYRNYIFSSSQWWHGVAADNRQCNFGAGLMREQRATCKSYLVKVFVPESAKSIFSSSRSDANRLHLAIKYVWYAMQVQRNKITQSRETLANIALSFEWEKKKTVCKNAKYPRRPFSSFSLACREQSKCIFSRVLTSSAPAMELNPWEQLKVLSV